VITSPFLKVERNAFLLANHFLFVLIAGSVLPDQWHSGDDRKHGLDCFGLGTQCPWRWPLTGAAKTPLVHLMPVLSQLSTSYEISPDVFSFTSF